ncbi:MAG: SOS response-associated peptidase family protein [Pyrinomonadaceae bacterium]
MCGRASQRHASRYEKYISYWETPETFVERNNLRPTEPAFIVARRSDGLIKTLEARWWCQWDGAKQFEAKFPTFNARVETMHDKKLWPDLLLKGQRCLLPVDSFYEWPIKGKGLPPVEIFVEGKVPYALAGLWSRYFDNGQTRYSFTTFTTEPNDFMPPDPRKGHARHPDEPRRTKPLACRRRRRTPPSLRRQNGIRPASRHPRTFVPGRES